MTENLPPLWNHQAEAIERAKLVPEFALFFEMGTGKSRTFIEIVRNLYNAERRVARTLILTPKIVVPNWKEEFAKFSKVPQDRIVLLHGTPAQRKKAWDYAKAKYGRDFIVVTNYDKLVDFRQEGKKRVNKSELLALLREWQPEVLALDESHKCKALKAGRTMAVLELASKRTNPAIRRKYLLSGTPILKDPMDLFSQFLILDDGKTFGAEFWPFKIQHMEDKNAKWKSKSHYFPKWEFKSGAVETIQARIQARSMRKKKSECLDLPPLLRVKRYVDMAPEQKRVYQEMKRDFIAFMNDKVSTASLALTKAQRLMQIASGYLQAEDGTKVKLKDTPKQEALSELLEELTPEHKVIVWAVYRENYAQVREVCDGLKIPFVEIHGEVSDAAKLEARVRFQNDPDCRVLIGHPGSGGIGINLTAASYSIFYSRSFSLDESQQAESRNHRGGSEIHERITRVDLVCKGTIEELVLKRIEEKETISEATLRQMVEELRSQEF